MKILDVPQSGSIAGSTSSRNRYGQYRRTRARPVNPNTAKQTAVRSTLTAISQQWRTLTPAQQAGWQTYANAHPVLDRLGSSIILSPNAMFIRINVPASLAGLPVVTTAPSSTPGPTPLPITMTPTIDIAGSSFDLAFDPSPMQAHLTVQVYAGAPQSAGVSFDKNLRLITQIAAADTSPTAIYSEYIQVWGAPQVGQKVFLRYDLFQHSVKIQSWTQVAIAA